MAIQLHYEDQRIAPLDGETVLDALLRVGTAAPFSCKGGSCHTCLMQCTEGAIPARAQRGLPEHLARMHYFLPCQCHAEADMHLRPPQPQDLVTPCMLCEATGHDTGKVQLIFEPQATLRYRQGQTLRVVTGEAMEPEIVLTSDPDTDLVMQGELCLAEGMALPPELVPDAEFGTEFQVRGPFDGKPARELPAPHTDPGLWRELDNGATVRAVLEAFYAKVYANDQLAPFFKGVTMQRAIEKQYVFLRQSMTGEKNDFVDTPRNTHHWMIITHALFELRQSLMEETLREHGLTGEQLRRWTRFEEHYRPDIVKSTVWPRLENGVEVMNEGFAREVLLEATLCDHCGAEVDQGVEVLYHLRTGTVSCPACAPAR